MINDIILVTFGIGCIFAICFLFLLRDIKRTLYNINDNIARTHSILDESNNIALDSQSILVEIKVNMINRLEYIQYYAKYSYDCTTLTQELLDKYERDYNLYCKRYEQLDSLITRGHLC